MSISGRVGGTAVGVNTADGSYAFAAAELPLSAQRTAAAAGSIVVISGDRGWLERAQLAEESGAMGVIVDDPWSARADDLARGAEIANRIPVVIARPRVRADIAEDALRTVADPAGMPLEGSPRLVAGECAASALAYDGMLRDAIGWTRILAGGRLTVCAAATVGDSITALLERGAAPGSSPPMPVTLLATRREAAPTWLRARTVGAVQTEIVVYGPLHAADIEFATSMGRSRPPRRFESYERLALRRGIAAVSARETVGDLADLIHDAELAERILAS